jgi:hypothetical protein
MINEFRRHPKIAGWLYTEHHDVINEWNGYYRFDRSEKYNGLYAFVPGMSIADFHRAIYISTGGDLCRDVKPGEEVEVPIYASFLTDKSPGANLTLRAELYGWDTLGRRETYSLKQETFPFEPWMSRELKPLTFAMPSRPALVVLALTLENAAGAALHRNFTTFLVADGRTPRSEWRDSPSGRMRIMRFAPNTFTDAKWSQKQWNVLDGLKVNGAGHGYFEYRLPWPMDVDPREVAAVSFVFEASAKELFGKDREGATAGEGDYMRGKGTHDPSANPNSYPMTDTQTHESRVGVRANGFSAGVYTLPDDPADHRGILSWHAQLKDKKLREAGSYGYLVQAVLPPEAIATAAKTKELVLRFEVDASLPGGLAIYGERFGRYPLDPTLIFEVR